MATRRLPAAPNLENLKNQAKGLLSALHDRETQALADFVEFYPQQLAPDDAHLTDAQLVLARSYGHASWQALAFAVQAQRDATQAGDPPGFPLDRAVNRRNVRSFLRVYAPEIAFVELELISALHGDSLEFHYDVDKRLKVPKSGRAALLKEARLFEYMNQQALPVEFPRVEFVHEQGLYAIYSRIPGTRLSAEVLQGLTPSQLSLAIESVARFFSLLHTHRFPADILSLIPRGDDPFEAQASRLRRKIQWFDRRSTRFDPASWMAQLERVERALHQRWEVIHCDPQLFRFHAVDGDLKRLGVADLHDALLHDPAVDLSDFLADASRDLPADGELAKRVKTLLLAAYETDDADITAKVDFMTLASEVRWADIEVRAELKAAGAVGLDDTPHKVEES